MTATSNLELPLIASNQAQKHITHNEALSFLDDVVQVVVKSVSLTNPPTTMLPGDRFGIPEGAQGDWEGLGGSIATWSSNQWSLLTAKQGWTIFDLETQSVMAWSGSEWRSTTASLPSSVDQLRINAEADLLNRLSVAGDASLFSHSGGGHQLKVNKSGASDTASVLFQNEFTGCAEVGVVGSNQFQIKTSNGGASWTTGLVVTEAGLVLQPQRPFFRVSPGQSGLSLSETAKISMDLVHDDHGGCFDPALGEFVAPVSGFFIFSASVRFDSMPNSGWMRLFFMRNGSAENYQLGHRIVGANHSTDWESLGISSVLHLNAGDKVSLHGGHRDGCTINPESAWMGAMM